MLKKKQKNKQTKKTKKKKKKKQQQQKKKKKKKKKKHNRFQNICFKHILFVIETTQTTFVYNKSVYRYN